MVLLVGLTGCPDSSEQGEDSTSGAEDSSGSSGGTGSTGGLHPDCECLGSPVGNDGLFTCDPGLECGAYKEHSGQNTGGLDPCSEDPTGTTGGTTPECDEELAANEAVVDCVLGAAADDEAFHFQRQVDPGEIAATYSNYWVKPGSPLYAFFEYFNDLIDDYYSSIREEPSFEACQGLSGESGWECIRSAVDQETIAECGYWDVGGL